MVYTHISGDVRGEDEWPSPAETPRPRWGDAVGAAPRSAQLGVPKARLGLAGARWVVLPRERGETNALGFSGISLELYQLKQLEGADESAHFLRSNRSRNVLKSCLYPELSTFLQGAFWIHALLKLGS